MDAMQLVRMSHVCVCMWVCVPCRLAGRQPLAVGGCALGADLRLWLCGASCGHHAAGAAGCVWTVLTASWAHVPVVTAVVMAVAVSHATWQDVSMAAVGMERGGWVWSGRGSG